VKTLVCRLISRKPSPLDVVYIGDIAELVTFPSKVRRRFDIHDRIENGSLCELGRSIPESDPSPESKTLILYAAAGLHEVALIRLWQENGAKLAQRTSQVISSCNSGKQLKTSTEPGTSGIPAESSGTFSGL
jgi:hypothetical protein